MNPLPPGSTRPQVDVHRNGQHVATLDVEPGSVATPVDRTGADDATFRATLARIEAAPAAGESAEGRVARAMWAEDAHVDLDQLSGSKPYRCLARAAIAALKPAPGTNSSGHAREERERAFMRDYDPALDDPLPTTTDPSVSRDAMRWDGPTADVLTDSSGQAVQRVLELCDGLNDRHPGARFLHVAAIREAIAGQPPDGTPRP